LARIERVYDWLSSQPDSVFTDTEAGEIHKVFDRLGKWERQAAADEERLALSPATRVRLGLDLARAKRVTLKGFIDGDEGDDED
jgi:hypothetical protein